jgi:Mlc titration factor MtfA (ptsG expression regulator)
VAASAVTLSVGWPDYEWDQLTEVLLYPNSFDRDYSFESPDLVGQAHGWGTIILSIPALRESFADPDDGYHVGIHEFAHLLELDQTRFDGIPPGLSPERSREWARLMDREMERMRKGKSVIDDYGAHEPAEFLAVAVEAFFESALELRLRHREVYDALAEYFRQDPAAWDDARGLKL